MEYKSRFFSCFAIDYRGFQVSINFGFFKSYCSIMLYDIGSTDPFKISQCSKKGWRLVLITLVISLIISLRSVTTQASQGGKRNKKKFPIYKVSELSKAMKIDGDWNKVQWRSVKALYLSHYMGQIPSFRPNVYVKMMYDQENLYLIFKVKDRFVSSIIEEYNGPVSTDACVEFFFSPDINLPEQYFNVEINAGGTPLMAYHIDGKKEYHKFSVEDLERIEISHSLPGKVDPEIITPITWTIEFKLPFSILKKYGSVMHPKDGSIWNANFYKTASTGSNPHYITWSRVDNLKPDFHLPQFFGKLQFGK